jgi:hypothetical protein
LGVWGWGVGGWGWGVGVWGCGVWVWGFGVWDLSDSVTNMRPRVEDPRALLIAFYFRQLLLRLLRENDLCPARWGGRRGLGGAGERGGERGRGGEEMKEERC